MADKPEIVAVTKADALPEDLFAEQVALVAAEAGQTPLAISAVSGTGLPALLDRLCALAASDSLAETPAPAWTP